MSYAAAAAVQAAIFGRLRADAALGALVGEAIFDAVPPGRYTLVVWQEALGTRTQPLRVEPGVTVRLTVDY